MALKDAVNDIIDALQELGDIRRVPDEPPENNDQFPFAVVYPLTGSYEMPTRGLMKGLHSINIELHVARKDLPRDYRQVMKLIDQIPNKLMKKQIDAGLSNMDTFGITEYTFGPLSWAGVDTLGVTYTVTDVKVQTAVT